MGVEKNYKRLAREFWLNELVPACVGDFLSGYFDSIARINSPPWPDSTALGFIKPSRRDTTGLLAPSDYLGFVSDTQFLQLKSVYGSPQSGYRLEKATHLMNTVQKFLTHDKEYAYLHWLKQGIFDDGYGDYLPERLNPVSSIDGGSCELSVWDVELSLIMAQTAGFHKKAVWAPKRSRSFSFANQGAQEYIYVYGRQVSAPGPALSYRVASVDVAWLMGRHFPLLGWSATAPTPESSLDKTVTDIYPTTPTGMPSLTTNLVMPASTEFNNWSKIAISNLDYSFQSFVDRVARNFPDEVHKQGHQMIDYILRSMEQQA